MTNFSSNAILAINLPQHNDFGSDRISAARTYSVVFSDGPANLETNEPFRRRVEAGEVES
jgi:hypothetical protein